MKNIFIITCVLIAGSTGLLFAQLEGKKFISGAVGINFSNVNPHYTEANKSFSYMLDLSLSKFKTNTLVTGWRINGNLGGGDATYTTYRQGEITDTRVDGVNSFGVGGGRYWHFYKHFNEKVGVYAGPGINLSFTNSKIYTLNNESTYLIENLNNSVTLALGLGAGIYYKLSDKWWVDAGLAFSDPFYISYRTYESNNLTSFDMFKSRQFHYTFKPAFIFPSVGLGVRYFYGR